MAGTVATITFETWKCNLLTTSCKPDLL